MHLIDIRNCNNIASGRISIRKNHLNIKLGINGTGKSTIAKSILIKSVGGDISSLKPFGGSEDPSINLPHELATISVFNDDFVKSVTFINDHVIENAFQVFIKSPDYDIRYQALREKLQSARIDIGEDEDIALFKDLLKIASAKITLTQSGKLARNVHTKSLLAKNTLYTVHPKLVKFSSFFQNPESNINWVDWKHKGCDFDSIAGCPFCAESLPQSYAEEKQAFTENYNKSSCKNLKELKGDFESLREFIADEKYESIISYIQSESEDNTTIDLILTAFAKEANYICEKISAISSFDSHRYRDKIGQLESELIGLKIDVSWLSIFCGSKSLTAYAKIEASISSALAMVNEIKAAMGSLKACIERSKQDTIQEINNFLSMAGMKYEFDIVLNGEAEAKSILKYKTQEGESVDVKKIKDHLSWGEKNAFALVLFMYKTLSETPDLIVLDDPISSFDANKKYAIIEKLFKNRSRSLYKSTVLMLTHDLEPVIDFIINHKPTGGFCNASFVSNIEGVVTEQEITIEDIESIVSHMRKISSDSTINIVTRVVSLRKYFELIGGNESAYNILSSLVHGNDLPTKIIIEDEVILTSSEIADGSAKIADFVTDFEYSTYITKSFNKAALFDLYHRESHPFYKIQIARTYAVITKKRAAILDPVFLKFLDETFHIENNYVYGLDATKYNLIPRYIFDKCENLMTTPS